MTDEVLELIQAGIRRVMENPTLKEELGGWKKTVLIKVGRDFYTIRVSENTITAAREKERKHDVEIQLDEQTFMQIAKRTLPFTTAYLRGLLTVKGDVQASDINRLQKLL